MKNLISLVLCLILTMVCCGAMAETDYTAIPEDMVVGFINYSDTLTAGVLVHQGMTRWCEDNGVDMIVVDADGDAAKQIAAVDSLILQGVDVVVDFNFNPAGGTYLLEACKTAGIPLISIDLQYKTEEFGNSYYAGVNNAEAGEIAGKAAGDKAIQKFGEGAKIDFVVPTYSVSLESVNDRTMKAYEGLLAAGFEIPEENLVPLEIGTGNATDLSLRQATDFLTAHPGAKIVFVCGNDDAASGFLSAVESQNRQDDCIIITLGCELPSQAWLKANDEVVLASVDFMFTKYADTIMPLAVRLVNGDTTCEELNYVQLGYLDAATVAEVYPD